MRSLIYFLSVSFSFLLTSPGFANADFLPADEAFHFQAESVSAQQIQLSWRIAPGYYLYHDKFKVSQTQGPVQFKLPAGKLKDDPTFGRTEVHYQAVDFVIPAQAQQQYQVEWQGCSKNGLCYPIQKVQFTTDADGLVPLDFNNNTPQARLKNSLLAANHGNNLSNDLATESPYTSVNSPIADASDPNAKATHIGSDFWNDDQYFYHWFNTDNLLLNFLIFFGLGILLAFLPCSLPLIPILSSLIVQGKRGLHALHIALAFVLSMALVYGVMGMLVSSIGFNLQRWLQTSIALGIFSTLFVIFALNLFGLFQISLPQGVLQRLNQLQDRQAQGRLAGAAIMGVLSALIVGPCMTAPLAGALVFVAQSQNSLLGGLYLFSLGIGIGTPLFIASVFGARLLPKPGIWMEHLKHSFAFVMLLLAVYFLRPLLHPGIHLTLTGIILLSWAIYLVRQSLYLQQWLSKTLFILFSLAVALASIHQFYNLSRLSHIRHADHALHHWHIVRNQNELAHAVQEANAQHQPIILDVYADWCAACQPLERDIFPRADVQQALQPHYLVRLDLTTQEVSQDQILKQREILGPPTLLFLDSNGQEQRDLRLTGSFKAEQLLQRLQHMDQRLNPHPN